MTATFTEWTADDSRALDAWARSHQARSPIEYDPRLAELLTEPAAAPVQIADNCQHCGDRLRPYHSYAVDHPGTVARSSADECQSCYRAIKEGRTPGTKAKRQRPPSHCLGCELTMRPALHPEGEVRHEGRGYCTRCYSSKGKRKQTT
ncbi:hypothetical protein [Rhodococcus sp. SJ-2]